MLARKADLTLTQILPYFPFSQVRPKVRDVVNVLAALPVVAIPALGVLVRKVETVPAVRTGEQMRYEAPALEYLCADFPCRLLAQLIVQRAAATVVEGSRFFERKFVLLQREETSLSAMRISKGSAVHRQPGEVSTGDDEAASNLSCLALLRNFEEVAQPTVNLTGVGFGRLNPGGSGWRKAVFRGACEHLPRLASSSDIDGSGAHRCQGNRIIPSSWPWGLG